ncbi:hypothetical protein DDZ13_07235 [Coraliomargarita sinensis]|uniref:HTH tetR-type domain-containing protein n=1 Tax=Coraliomargarita sinensis TaxID=2174842 RepID=A0A317ZJA2_9BACT|nr:TetR/AcrR family transcriptional regulator [Coraliomargarita sinensis]PXA04317.1 hypothetical protein DDZ13_07235 [Coraliomargarita sinensis]
MPKARKRSRSATEQRFQDAAIELVAESGFAQIGVNSVAERAGSDKVLIYRYFGDFEGLLQRVAQSRSWLPAADELVNGSNVEPAHVLSHLAGSLSRHIRGDAATRQICLWRHVANNPLTRSFTTEWKSLWKELPEILGGGLGYEARQKWAQACALLALTIEADLAGETVDPKNLDSLSAQLERPISAESDDSSDQKSDVLPTNLL